MSPFVVFQRFNDEPKDRHLDKGLVANSHFTIFHTRVSYVQLRDVMVKLWQNSLLSFFHFSNMVWYHKLRNRAIKYISNIITWFKIH